MLNSSDDQARQQRLSNEVFVDAYTEEELAQCWYHYLERKVTFPFEARWGKETLEIVGMDSASESADAEVQMDALYREGDIEDIISVRAADLVPLQTDAATAEAIEDLQYWINSSNR